MSKAFGIIADQERTFEVDLDGIFEGDGILCDGETCRHSECDCWDSFEAAAEAAAIKARGIYTERNLANTTPERNWDYLAFFESERNEEGQRYATGRTAGHAAIALLDQYDAW